MSETCVREIVSKSNCLVAMLIEQYCSKHTEFTKDEDVKLKTITDVLQ